MSARPIERFPLRLPADLRDRIKVIAHVKRQSVNSEIVHVLEKAFPARDPLIDMVAALEGELEADLRECA